MGCICGKEASRKQSNALLDRTKGKTIHVVDFLRLWFHYDKDRSGYIEGEELELFVSDLVKKQGVKEDTPEAVQAATRLFLKMFDTNRDKKIELREFVQIIFTDNQWTPFDVRDKLKKKDFDEIFAYYDKDGSQQLECREMQTFLRDIMLKIGQVNFTIILTQGMVL
ncbi:DgyrCDS47 [Dimorphilus gyrociliatus]|uniref:DgyrCDS47 n=1 Tax=Dimorphilus gyrociliatus TaxID=2664684 RepID=A0A7I8V3Q7_9ANNE|nr:DgyrCDS47 [Dimorphilus gyrociliatus]